MKQILHCQPSPVHSLFPHDPLDTCNQILEHALQGNVTHHVVMQLKYPRESPAGASQSWGLLLLLLFGFSRQGFSVALDPVLVL